MPQNTNCQDSHLQSQTPAYKQRLSSWTVARLLPDEQRVTVARFRSLSDAEGRIRLMRQLAPDARFELVFDCQREEVAN